MGRGRTRDIICHEEETNMKIRAEMGRRHAPLWPHEYQVDKVVELPNVAFASFMIQPLDSYDFIRDNRVEPHQGTGLNHCLLLLGDDRTDGALVQCGDDGRAMYAAYVAGARDVVQARRSIFVLDKAVISPPLTPARNAGRVSALRGGLTILRHLFPDIRCHRFSGSAIKPAISKGKNCGGCRSF